MSAPEPVVEQAIAWRVRLASGTCAEADFAACLRWRQQSVEHERVWQRLEHLGERFAMLPAGVGQAVLQGTAADPARRRALKALAVLMTVGGAGLVASERSLRADIRTAAGERRLLSLPDGGQLHVNAGSAVDVDYDAERRLIRLYHGEILVQTAADARPFLVSTAQGLLRALGTRFLVHEHAHSCELAVYAGAVEVCPLHARPQVVQAGRQVIFDAGHIQAEQVADRDRGSWVDGVLVAREMRLADFAAELARQRHGVLRCAPQVAELRISGVFPLADSERVLAAVAQTLPVRVVYRTRYWVTLQSA